MRLSDATIFVVDTETTGTDPDVARIVELGAVVHLDGVVAGSSRALVNPGVPIPREASVVHGITDADVADAETFAAAWPAFRNAAVTIADVTCGYNATHYDVPLIDAEAARHGVEGWPVSVPVLDPLVWLQWHERGRSGRLVDACARHGVTLTEAHSAVADATAAGALLMALVDAGIVPDDSLQAVAQQMDIADRLAEERAKWGHYLYRRDDDALRVGFGRHRGRRLRDVPADYLRFVLDRFDGLPDSVRSAMASAGGRDA